VVELLRRALIVTAVCAIADSGAFVVALAQTTFTSRIEAVRVDVLVTENGQPLQGLTASDFEVLDDVSASLQGLRLGHLQTASKALLDGLKPDDRVGLVTFSHVIVPSVPLGEASDRVRAALDEAQGEGLTSLIDATYTGMMMGESEAGRSLLIVFSDGVDTSSWLTAESVLETARRGEVVVYGIEIGSPRDSFPRAISEATGGRLFALESTKDLSTVFSRILEEFRVRYLISYSPEGVTSTGWHQLEVRVRKRGATVRARPGYFASN
jgi:VWFA-related protein